MIGIAIVEVQAKIHYAKNVTQGKEMDRNIEKKFIKENEKDEMYYMRPQDARNHS